MLFETCTKCRVPLSTHSDILWCLYCTYARDRTKRYVRAVVTHRTQSYCCIHDRNRRVLRISHSGLYRECKYKITGCCVFIHDMNKYNGVCLVEYLIPT